MKLYQNSGWLLFATGFIHNLLGSIMGWNILRGMANDGLVNTINMQMDRNAIFWFLFSGFLMMIAGKVMQDHISETQRPLPASTGYYLLALSIAGCSIMPASGIWLALPQALIIIIAGRNRVTRPSVSEKHSFEKG